MPRPPVRLVRLITPHANHRHGYLLANVGPARVQLDRAGWSCRLHGRDADCDDVDAVAELLGPALLDYVTTPWEPPAPEHAPAPTHPTEQDPR